MSKRLILTITTFVVLLLSLVTVTYAWIVIARYNYISSIDFNVVLGSGLEISFDGTNYSNHLDGAKLSEMYPNILFSDITTQDGIIFEQGYSREQPIKNKNYLSFKIYFRTENNNFTAIHLVDFMQNVKYSQIDMPSGTYATSKGMTFKSDIDFNHGPNDLMRKHDERIFHASEALRISTFNSDYIKIFDLSNNHDRGFATALKQYGAVDYFKKHNPNKQLEIPNSPTLSEFSSIVDEVYADHQGSRVATLKKSQYDSYWYAEMTVNIWIEGWDLDAFNAIMGDEFLIGLKFVALLDDIYYS